MKRSNLSLNLFLMLFMLVGLALLGAGIFFTVDRNQKMNTYEAARGGIVDYRAREGDNGMVYGAVYAYTVDGKEYTVCDKIFTNKIPRIGERVQIMYDPADPGNAFAKGAVSDGFFLLALGGMFFAIPLFLLIRCNYSSLGRRGETVQGIFIGLIFVGLGYGLCFGLRQGINFTTIFLFLFGSVGVYMAGYSVYALFKPEKQSSDSLGNTTNLQQEPYYVPDEQYYQEDALTTQLQEENVEKIERIRNKIETGVSIAREIQRIIGGLVFSVVGGFAIIVFADPNVTAAGMPRLFMVLFLGIFVVVGLSQVVKGIIELLRK